MKSNRRDFLKTSALASCSMLVPGFLKSAFGSSASMNFQGKRLIVIQLSGGNDGLNTFVPFENDLYYKARPELSIAKNIVIPISEEIGMNPALSKLQAHFEQGELALFNSVGYPNPVRSHFRSMDIWQSGSDTNEYINSGWLGRYLDAKCVNCESLHELIEVDVSLSLAVKGNNFKGLSMQDPERLYRMMKNLWIRMLSVQKGGSNDPLNYMYKTLSETHNSAAHIYKVSKTYHSKTKYAATPFGKSLRLISELINSGLETSVYYTSLSGFDTHVSQRKSHDRLLNNYATGISTLIKDLKTAGNWKDTLILTFSEFGRRVKENASKGTDHGTANSLWVMGGDLKNAGILNKAPDLKGLDKGDLKYQVDFRQIYATILDKWLDTNHIPILGREYKLLDLI